MISRKVLFITGSRGEWGYIRPILKLIQKREDITSKIVVTNMHLLPSYGNSYKEIEEDGFKIDFKIHMSLDGYSHKTMVKSLGIFLMSLPDILETEKPDWIMIAGDRGEQLMGAIVGAFTYTPVAHIQAGELSGNVDGMTRHAIGKYAHIHFASNQDAADRLKKLGEDDFRIYHVGAPQIDEMQDGLYTSKQELQYKYNLMLDDGYILALMHPNTEEFGQLDDQISTLCHALNKINLPKILIMPNNDAGSTIIKRGWDKYKQGEYHVFLNLSRQDYLGFLKNCLCIVGNSSSGLLEAPTFKVPAINIGRRQNMRIRGINVIDVACDSDEIDKAIHKAMSVEFRDYLEKNCVNPYGDGKSSQKIVDILVNTKIDSHLLNKNLTY